MTEEDFYPKSVRNEVEAKALTGTITGGFVNQTAEGPSFDTQAGAVLALVRVRQGGPAGPTRDEMQAQIDAGVPMVVVSVEGMGFLAKSYVWGDHLLDAPLLDRPFVHGIFDCYEALRSWKWQKEAELLPPMARDDRWWDREMQHNPNLYLKHFRDIGYSEFRPAPRTPLDLDAPDLAPQIGDGILFQIGEAKTVNHAAIYLGYGNIYHHLFRRTSEISNLDKLPRNFVVRKWLRRTDKLKENLK